MGSGVPVTKRESLFDLIVWGEVTRQCPKPQLLKENVSRSRNLGSSAYQLNAMVILCNYRFAKAAHSVQAPTTLMDGDGDDDAI